MPRPDRQLCHVVYVAVGQFESYLFQRGENTVMAAIKRCWSSCFSERVMSHRVEVGAVTTGLKMAVIVQVSSSSMLLCVTNDKSVVCVKLFALASDPVVHYLHVILLSLTAAAGDGELVCQWCGIFSPSSQADII